MSCRRILSALCLLSVLSLASFSALADTAGASVSPPTANVQAAAKPLLIIRFNQNRVYFDHVLRQALEAAQQAKPGALFSVVSYIPSGRNQARSESIAADATDNLNAVVQQMEADGVDSSRIQASSQPAQQGMSSQEVHIFVK